MACDSRRVSIPRQAVLDHGVVTLESGLLLEDALDALNLNHMDQLRLVLTDEPTKPAAKEETPPWK